MLNSQNNKLSSCPNVFEESWQKTDPNIFFLPDSETLNFQGKSAVEHLNNPLNPWKVLFKSFDFLSSRLDSLKEKFGERSVELLHSQSERMIFIEITSGIVNVYASSNVSGCVEFMSEPFHGKSVATKSEIGGALGTRLNHLNPHQLSCRLTADSTKKNSPVPLVVIANGLETHFVQFTSVFKFVVAKEAQAEFLLLEGNGAFSLSRKHFVVEEGAKLQKAWVFVQNESEKTSTTLLERIIELKGNAEFFDKQLFVPKSVVRVTSNIKLQGIRAVSQSLAALISSSGKFDYEPIQEHFVAETKSSLFLKGIFAKRAQSLFQGLVILHKEASKSEAYQENKNLLTSRNARADSKPRLEILQKDVMCKHGSATAEIEQNQLYYLKTRGFSESAAKSLIIKAFCQEPLLQQNNESPFLSDFLFEVSEFALTKNPTEFF